MRCQTRQIIRRTRTYRKLIGAEEKGGVKAEKLSVYPPERTLNTLQRERERETFYILPTNPKGYISRKS